MAVAFVDDAGARLQLGPELGRGGEGTVFDLPGTPLAAKIYHRPAEPAKAAKLEAMVRLRAPALSAFSAWPERRILDHGGTHTWGILLPKVLDHRAIHELYSPADRKIEFPFADWTFLVHVARNCAAAFEAIHAAGHVVGDVNQGGVFVSKQGTIMLIDCDSYQIADGARLFTCDVGVPHFTAPELQGQSFRGLQRTPQHDAFGLAVLLFHLLFMGRHPFAGRYLGKGDMPVERAIKEGRFAYGPHADRVQMTPPPHSLRLSQVPDEIAGLFERAFRLPGGPHARPNATDWLHALERLKGSIVACPQRRAHTFASRASACPWCDIARAGGPDLFVSAQVLVQIEASPTTFDLALFWRDVEAVPPPMPTWPRADVGPAKAGAADPRRRDGMGVGHGDGRCECRPALLRVVPDDHGVRDVRVPDVRGGPWLGLVHHAGEIAVCRASNRPAAGVHDRVDRSRAGRARVADPDQRRRAGLRRQARSHPDPLGGL